MTDLSAGPNLEISWCDGWLRSQKRTVRPMVAAAIDLAREGFEALEVPLEGDKTFRLYRAGETYTDAATSVRQGLIELYLKVNDVRYRKLGAKLGLYSVVLMHEMIHDERLALFPESNLAEHAVTEGLAHCGDAMFARLLMWPEEHHDVFRLVDSMTPGNAELLTRALSADVELDQIESKAGTNTICDQWFEEETSEFHDYPIGVAVGSYHVARHLRSGQTLAELMHRTPEEILLG